MATEITTPTPPVNKELYRGSIIIKEPIESYIVSNTTDDKTTTLTVGNLYSFSIKNVGKLAGTFLGFIRTYDTFPELFKFQIRGIHTDRNMNIYMDNVLSIHPFDMGAYTKND